MPAMIDHSIQLVLLQVSHPGLPPDAAARRRRSTRVLAEHVCSRAAGASGRTRRLRSLLPRLQRWQEEPGD